MMWFLLFIQCFFFVKSTQVSVVSWTLSLDSNVALPTECDVSSLNCTDINLDYLKYVVNGNTMSLYPYPKYYTGGQDCYYRRSYNGRYTYPRVGYYSSCRWVDTTIPYSPDYVSLYWDQLHDTGSEILVPSSMHLKIDEKRYELQAMAVSQDVRRLNGDIVKEDRKLGQKKKVTTINGKTYISQNCTKIMGKDGCTKFQCQPRTNGHPYTVCCPQGQKPFYKNELDTYPTYPVLWQCRCDDTTIPHQDNSGEETYCKPTCTGNSVWYSGSTCTQCPTNSVVSNGVCVCNNNFILVGSGASMSCVCPEKTYQNINNICMDCPAGQFQDEVNKSSCKYCKGEGGVFLSYNYQDESGQDHCKSCMQFSASNYVNTDALMLSTYDYTRCVECSISPDYRISKIKDGQMPDICVCQNGYYRDSTVRNSTNKNSICTYCPAGFKLKNEDIQVIQNSWGGTTRSRTGYEDDNGSATSCQSCPAGKYQNEVGKSSCKDCSIGFYEVADASLICKACPLGQYQYQTGQTRCKICELGQIISQTGCLTCDNGEYQDEYGENICKTCSTGQYAPNASSPCQDCPSGKYQLDTTSTEYSCKTCSAGQYVHNVSSPCVYCSVGKYSLDGDSSCNFCEAGKKYSRFDSACENCPKGKYQSSNSEPYAFCHDCPNGWSAVANGSQSCNYCDIEEGYMYAGPSDSCKPCDVGKVMVNGVCETCTGGKFQDETPKFVCKSCFAGQYLMNNKCQNCTSGKYQPGTYTENGCKLCPVGFFSNSVGSSNCTRCDDGQYQDNNGQITCKTNCPPYKMPHYLTIMSELYLSVMSNVKLPHYVSEPELYTETIATIEGQAIVSIPNVERTGCASPELPPLCPSGQGLNPDTCVSCSATLYRPDFDNDGVADAFLNVTCLNDPFKNNDIFGREERRFKYYCDEDWGTNEHFHYWNRQANNDMCNELESRSCQGEYRKTSFEHFPARFFCNNPGQDWLLYNTTNDKKDCNPYLKDIHTINECGVCANDTSPLRCLGCNNNPHSRLDECGICDGPGINLCGGCGSCNASSLSITVNGQVPCIHNHANSWESTGCLDVFGRVDTYGRTDDETEPKTGWAIYGEVRLPDVVLNPWYVRNVNLPSIREMKGLDKKYFIIDKWSAVLDNENDGRISDKNTCNSHGLTHLPNGRLMYSNRMVKVENRTDRPKGCYYMTPKDPHLSPDLNWFEHQDVDTFRDNWYHYTWARTKWYNTEQQLFFNEHPDPVSSKQSNAMNSVVPTDNKKFPVERGYDFYLIREVNSSASYNDMASGMVGTGITSMKMSNNSRFRLDYDEINRDLYLQSISIEHSTEQHSSEWKYEYYSYTKIDSNVVSFSTVDNNGSFCYVKGTNSVNTYGEANCYSWCTFLNNSKYASVCYKNLTPLPMRDRNSEIGTKMLTVNSTNYYVSPTGYNYPSPSEFKHVQLDGSLLTHSGVYYTLPPVLNDRFTPYERNIGEYPISKVSNDCFVRKNRVQCPSLLIEVEGELMSSTENSVCVKRPSNKLECYFSATSEWSSGYDMPLYYEDVISVDMDDRHACGIFTNSSTNIFYACWGNNNYNGNRYDGLGFMNHDIHLYDGPDTVEQYEYENRVFGNIGKLSQQGIWHDDWSATGTKERCTLGFSMPGNLCPEKLPDMVSIIVPEIEYESDIVTINVSSQEESLVVGCMEPDACNFNARAEFNAPPNHKSECWFPFNMEYYECGENQHNPYFNKDANVWMFNPGKCLAKDSDENGWCDDLDEIWGCLNPRGCNFGGGNNWYDIKKTIGSTCISNQQCLTNKCRFCHGTFKCVDYDDEDKCSKVYENMEIITQHNENFCRFPYSDEFKCKDNDREFSSMKGIAIKDDEQKDYLEMTTKNRKKMIRCQDIPMYKSRCNTVEALRSCDDDSFDANDACCYCGGGRVFDTSRGNPIVDIDRNNFPDSWATEGCPDIKACNYNPISTNNESYCLYNDQDNDGVCDDLIDTFLPVCGEYGASNYKSKVDPNIEYYNPSVCNFTLEKEYNTCQEYMPHFGCMDISACNYNWKATQSDLSCTYFKSSQTCDNSYIYTKCIVNLPNTIPNICPEELNNEQSCTPQCKPSHTPSATTLTCKNGQLSPFRCIAKLCNTTDEYIDESGTCVKATNCSQYQYQLFGPVGTYDRVCRDVICHCDNGIPSTQCTLNSEHTCESCYEGYRLDTNQTCFEIECNCENGTPLDICLNETKACGYCNSGYYLHANKCLPVPQCELFHYFDTDRRICREFSGDCVNGVTTTNKTNFNQCESCDDGYYLDGILCSPWEGTCDNGNLTSQTLRTQHNHCESCDDGYYLDGIVCSPWEGTCVNGLLISQTLRTQHNHCSACNDGYYLDGIVCSPWEGTCVNGNLTSQTLRTQHNHCESCDDGYYLDGAKCSVWKSCSNDEREVTKANSKSDRKCAKIQLMLRSLGNVNCGETQFLKTKIINGFSNTFCEERKTCSSLYFELITDNTTDTECIQRTPCPLNSYVETYQKYSDHKCANLTICNVTQYELKPPTYWSDRQCDQQTCDIGEEIVDGTCRICTEGKFRANHSKPTCIRQSNCGKGSFIIENGTITSARKCGFCAAGQYQDQDNQHSCKNCNLGKKSPFMGLESCIKCTVGKFTNVEGAVTCQNCAAGTYQDITGQSSCKQCGEGKDSYVGKTSCYVMSKCQRIKKFYDTNCNCYSNSTNCLESKYDYITNCCQNNFWIKFLNI